MGLEEGLIQLYAKLVQCRDRALEGSRGVNWMDERYHRPLEEKKMPSEPPNEPDRPRRLLPDMDEVDKLVQIFQRMGERANRMLDGLQAMIDEFEKKDEINIVIPLGKRDNG